MRKKILLLFTNHFRFSKARDEFLNALLMVQRQIMPGKLTWPTTKVTVEETCPEYLKVSFCTLNNMLVLF